MGKYVTVIVVVISILFGCSNIEETKASVVVPVIAETPEPIAEEPINLPITETWEDSLVLDSARTIYIVTKQRGNFGDPSWVSGLSLVEITNNDTFARFSCVADGALNGVKYIDSSLALVKKAKKSEWHFFMNTIWTASTLIRWCC